MADCCAQKRLAWRPFLLLVYFIINIRVEAGIATAFERALDGLVAGALLLALLYVGARFIRLLEAGDDDPLACCGKAKK